MADLSILFSGLATKTQLGYKDDQDNLFGVIQLDATLSETHTFQTTLTKNEIEEPEDGESNQINDNAVLAPEQLKLEGIVSEVPINLLDAIKNVGAGLISNVSGIAGGAAAFLSTELMSDGVNKQQKALQQLLLLWRNRIPFTVVTGLRTYDDMMITNISIPRDTKIGKSLKFSISLQKVKFVRSDIVSIPKSVLKKGVKHSASSKQDAGKQETSTADQSVSDRGSSIAARMLF